MRWGAGAPTTARTERNLNCLEACDLAQILHRGLLDYPAVADEHYPLDLEIARLASGAFGTRAAR